jgi:hypothetical protein
MADFSAMSNAENFPLPAVFVPADRRNKDHVLFVASWCGHDAYAPLEDITRLREFNSICTDCGIEFFPEQYNAILGEVIYRHEVSDLGAQVNLAFMEGIQKDSLNEAKQWLADPQNLVSSVLVGATTHLALNRLGVHGFWKRALIHAVVQEGRAYTLRPERYKEQLRQLAFRYKYTWELTRDPATRAALTKRWRAWRGK